MTVSFNTIPADNRVPLFYAEMDNSAANTALGGAPSLLVGMALPESDMPLNQLVIMPSKDLAKKMAGRGSQLARMVEAYRQVDPFGELWVIAVPDNGEVATGTVTVTGTVTDAGSVNLYVGTRKVQVTVATGDTGDQVAQALVSVINNYPDLPVSAEYQGTSGGDAQGTVNLSAVNSGTVGNSIPLTLNYYGTASGEETPAGLSIQIGKMSGGAGDPDLSESIAAMGDEPFDYIGLPFSDANSLQAMSVEMNDSSGRWSYIRQLYGHVYTARTGTLSELVAYGDTFNYQHITIAGYEKEVQTCVDELVGYRLARAAVFLRIDPARPTQTGELTGALPAPTGKRFTITEQQSLLMHGIATAYTEAGVLRIQRDITTYKTNAYGVADNSYLDSETLHTSAYVLRRLKSVITSKYGRHKLANDGTRFGPGQAIVTPAVIRGELGSTYRQLEREGIVENFDLFQQYLIVERNANDPNRLDVLFPPDYVNQLRVFAVLNQFRLQYNEEAA
ncbi:phage tail sheath subtilisin-like domain-containing protein [Citrobacter koseri]|uniref:phage tail sheath subtilisin-like domain-containing protein n=1 Tax=Citrobacter koseri TaxID=545 RepID=UPI00190564C2|nr:phage tail sheath subtilisin-like domain-containing protein [Citrobacter koseri]EKX8766223.1 phage tail sheath subtilisin-like domain-containing protein [Citrobacter koseri]ELJ2663724.1 phage tail sheath subtilisin-like domain-containing protein [Citrobacter koseri]MBJ9646112.1 phage tail sheath subtilisin-like domain-containing protein [Citrobacter koseri]HEM8490435.1 phage tail sheath subtilisin-like domain-containing protein [Citrobacter koseri]